MGGAFAAGVPPAALAINGAADAIAKATAERIRVPGAPEEALAWAEGLAPTMRKRRVATFLGAVKHDKRCVEEAAKVHTVRAGVRAALDDTAEELRAKVKEV